MKAWFSIFLMVTIFLAGCSSAEQTPTATTMQDLASPMPSAAATQFATSPPATDSPPPSETLLASLTPTAALVQSDTAIPTDTPGVIVIEIVGEAALSPASQGPVASQGCQSPPAAWVRYTVRASDTLSSLGQRTGTNWQRIQAANCLGSTMILAGQTLYLPFIPPASPSQGNAGASDPVPSAEAPAAPNPNLPPLAIYPASGPAGTVFVMKLGPFGRNEDVVITVLKPNFEEIYRVQVRVDNYGFGWASYPSAPGTAPMSYRVKAQSASTTAQETITITP